jgi:hypothetical protein
VNPVVSSNGYNHGRLVYKGAEVTQGGLNVKKTYATTTLTQSHAMMEPRDSELPRGNETGSDTTLWTYCSATPTLGLERVRAMYRDIGIDAVE